MSYSEAARHLSMGQRIKYKNRDGVIVRGTIKGTTFGGGKRVEFDDKPGESFEFGSMAACALVPIPERVLAVEAAIAFIEGFEGDEAQAGVSELLARLRAVVEA